MGEAINVKEMAERKYCSEVDSFNSLLPQRLLHVYHFIQSYIRIGIGVGGKQTPPTSENLMLKEKNV